MSSARPSNNMPHGPSKLRHMKRADSSRSRSPEASNSPSRQRYSSGRQSARTQSTDQIEDTNNFARGKQRLHRNLASEYEDGNSGESDYEVGDEAESSARSGTGNGNSGAGQGDSNAVQGTQLPTSSRFLDSDGNLDLDAIQDDDIRGLPLSNSAMGHAHAGHSQSHSSVGAATSTRRRREQNEDEQDQDIRKAKRPRIEGD